MTIDEAIKHCMDIAETQEMCSNGKKCAKEHRQLAEWLKELQRYREAWDKVKAEIETLIEWHDCPIEYDNGNDAWYCEACNQALKIIDKYKAESEG